MNKKRNPQKRGGFVPIGDVADGLSLPGGRALTHRAATPQARHHFTRLDQIDQLVAASEADADLGFMARLLALCSLPRSNPGNRLQYERVNGPYKLYMISGGGNKLPYGTRPRLLLAWVCSEAVRTQSRELILGDSLSAFSESGHLQPAAPGLSTARTLRVHAESGHLQPAAPGLSTARTSCRLCVRAAIPAGFASARP